ncbi:MAG: hypothetical protein NT069_25085 [Planctomycetota bacterium]|nr:hypothetical protein [Planctomycetota bacterium]
MRISRAGLSTIVLVIVLGTSVQGLAQSGLTDNSLAVDAGESIAGEPSGEWTGWNELATGLNPDDTYRDPETSSWSDVAVNSLVGPLRTDLWRPLEWETFFTDGWDEQYAPAPHETPHQGWITNADSGFYRVYVASFAYAAGVPGAGSGKVYNGAAFLYTPLNRRFELGWFFPFVTSTPSPSGAQTNVGDLTIAPRFLLEERKNFSVTANVYIRTPTGNAVNGQGVTSYSPDIEFWWTEPTQHWVLRGGVGVTVPVEYSGEKADLLAANPWTGFNASPGAFKSFDARLAVGRHLTAGDDPTFSHLVVNCAWNLHTQLEGGNNTYFSVAPGFRFQFSKDWYLLGGVEVPLVGPLPFSYQPLVQVIKAF